MFRGVQGVLRSSAPRTDCSRRWEHPHLSSRFFQPSFGPSGRGLLAVVVSPRGHIPVIVLIPALLMSDSTSSIASLIPMPQACLLLSSYLYKELAALYANVSPTQNHPRNAGPVGGSQPGFPLQWRSPPKVPCPCSRFCVPGLSSPLRYAGAFCNACLIGSLRGRCEQV